MTSQSLKIRLAREAHFLMQITKANLKKRYEGSFLGVLWYLMGPLLMFAVLHFVFARRIGADIENYPLYLLLGLLLWNFTQAASSSALICAVQQGGLMKAVPVRKDVLVLSVVINAFINHTFELLIFFIFAWFYGVLSLMALLFPFVIFLNVLFTLGMSFFLSACYLHFRDLQQIWSVLVRVWWFATPIFYSPVPGGPGERISMFNPMFHIIDISRDVLIYARLPELYPVGILILFSFSTFIIGYSVFRGISPRFPEYV